MATHLGASPRGHAAGRAVGGEQNRRHRQGREKEFHEHKRLQHKTQTLYVSSAEVRLAPAPARLADLFGLNARASSRHLAAFGPKCETSLLWGQSANFAPRTFTV